MTRRNRSERGDPILAFYRLEGTDTRGRRLDEIWTWDVNRLEAVHDYVQWLFPLYEPSAFNPDAPLLTDDTVSAFVGDATLRARLARSLEVMLHFYGLTLVEHADRIAIVEGPQWAVRSRQWISPGNHNYLRITRILASLNALGLPGHAEALLERLRETHAAHRGEISDVTFGYWSRAASGF